MKDFKIPAPQHPKERNDCVVRALTSALDTDYGKAHRICRHAGRRNRNGMITHKAVLQVREEWGQKYRTLKRGVGGTLANFIATHPIGSFVVTVRRHAIAIVNGAANDDTHPRRIIKQAYKLL
jgi:hypothetical protein